MTTLEAKSEFYIAGIDNVPQIEPPRQAKHWNAPHIERLSPRQVAHCGAVGLLCLAAVFVILVVSFCAL